MKVALAFASPVKYVLPESIWVQFAFEYWMRLLSALKERLRRSVMM